MWREILRREMASSRSTGESPFTLRDKPQPITREWARGSVEWERQQRGEGGPPPPNEKPTLTNTSTTDPAAELFAAILKG